MPMAVILLLLLLDYIVHVLVCLFSRKSTKPDVATVDPVYITTRNGQLHIIIICTWHCRDVILYTCIKITCANARACTV